MQGCLYVAPAWEQPVNIGPAISVPTNFLEGDIIPLPFVTDPTRVSVLANDPDDEILTFVWEVHRANEAPMVTDAPTDGGDWLSVITIPEEHVQSGDIIKCTVTDQAQPSRNSVKIEWLVEVK